MLPCFNYLCLLFYNDRKKIIPSNITDFLTEVGLAFFLNNIMDDGGVGSGGILNLNTDSDTENEIELLMDALTQNFNLKCRKSRFYKKKKEPISG